MPIQAPPHLRPGDQIAIVSTARKITMEELTPALKVLESWGLGVILGPSLLKKDHQFAGTDEQRAADFQWALDAPEVKAILCARGGYGTVRIIDLIDFSGFKKQPKWVIGYSDVTVLHNHIHTNCQVETLHATMPINFATNSEEALLSLRTALFGASLQYTFSKHECNRAGEATGVLVGGNLSILYSLTGSNSDLDTRGKILFLEDLDEYLYHVDRMLYNLKKAGKLADLAGLIVGGMTDMNDNATPFGKSAIEIIHAATKEYAFPVAFGFPAGHQADNRAMKLGAVASFRVGEESSFEQA